MMKRNGGWMWTVLIAASSLAATPALAAGGGKSLGKPSGVIPATVEEIPGSDLRKVTLTERAAERIDLQMESVRGEVVGDEELKVVPYSSLIYDPHGGTWVYTETSARTFVRAHVDVDSIRGNDVFFTGGPPVGSRVASVGVAEIYGEEYGVGH